MNNILKKIIVILVITISLIVKAEDANTLSNLQTQLIITLETLKDKPKNLDALIKLKLLKDKASDFLDPEWFYACCFISDFINNNKKEAKQSYNIIKDKYSLSDAFIVSSMENMYKDCDKCKGTGKTPKMCPECKGSGRCVHCKGRGTIPYMRLRRRDPCSRCNGKGTCKTCGGSGTAYVRCNKCFGKKRKFSKEKLYEVHANIFNDALQYTKGFVKYEDRWITKATKEKIDAGFIFYDNEWLSPKEQAKRKLAAFDYEGLVNCDNEYLLNPPAAGVGFLKDKIVEYTGVVIPMPNSTDGKIACVAWNKYNGFVFWLASKYSDELLKIKIYDEITIRGIHTGRNETIEMSNQDSVKFDQLKQQRSGDKNHQQSLAANILYKVNMQIITNAQIVIQKEIKNKTNNSFNRDKSDHKMDKIFEEDNSNEIIYMDEDDNIRIINTDDSFLYQ